jgi:thioredoxin reductase (NADPH)
MIFDLIIIGSGPAGLTAAIYASRAELKTLVLGGSPPGGQLTLTTDVENFPGFPDGILGPQLISQMRQQAQKFGAQFLDLNVIQIKSNKTPFTLTTEDKKTHQAKSVIIATGASAKWLNLPSEKQFIGKGVSSCATCDGFFFKNKTVAVIGGGDTAMEDALFLTKFAKKIHIIHRRDTLRATKILQARVHKHPKIKVIWNSQVQEFLGDQKLTGLKFLTTDKRQPTTLSVDGAFVAIGYQPNTNFLKGYLDLDPKGYIKATDSTCTSIPGIFAAGDVVDFRYQQAVNAAGRGCMAALDAEKWLDKGS